MFFHHFHDGSSTSGLAMVSAFAEPKPNIVPILKPIVDMQLFLMPKQGAKYALPLMLLLSGAMFLPWAIVETNSAVPSL